MQRPNRPGRFYVTPPDPEWEDFTRPDTPDVRILDGRLRMGSGTNDARRFVRAKSRKRGFNFGWPANREGGFVPEGTLFFNPDQAHPPRPAPPPPPSHDPVPGPSSGSNNCSSSSGNNNDVMSRLLSVLECPVCLDYISPPIQQCREGHLVCSRCRPRLESCPKCRQPFADIRARALEQIAEVVPYPCYNTGCGAMPTLAERQAHESICPFREYPCPIEPCSWAGPRPSVPQHMGQHHPDFLVTSSNHEVRLTLTQHMNEEKSFVMHCFDEIFHCVMGVDCLQDIFVGLVMYLGPRNNAKDFDFELKFKRDSPPHTCVSIHRAALEESHLGTQLSGTSAVVISFSTLREVIQEEMSRPPILTVYITVTRRIKSSTSSSPASPNPSPSLN
ncbi:E3 ubiquitin-protein ligase SIAH1A [Halyomorpha halys]|uniref:E3 ubiquitin-protein ligase SIAH1A n=1 Tax=Halyomorpha halys TaxID=286706 RepID=UPI0006D5230E|nr:E3 ubiquitin-protein ligase SIAH1 [Halyomorpha halys]